MLFKAHKICHCFNSAANRSTRGNERIHAAAAAVAPARSNTAAAPTTAALHSVAHRAAANSNSWFPLWSRCNCSARLGLNGSALPPPPPRLPYILHNLLALARLVPSNSTSTSIPSSPAPWPRPDASCLCSPREPSLVEQQTAAHRRLSARHIEPAARVAPR